MTTVPNNTDIIYDLIAGLTGPVTPGLLGTILSLKDSGLVNVDHFLGVLEPLILGNDNSTLLRIKYFIECLCVVYIDTIDTIDAQMYANTFMQLHEQFPEYFQYIVIYGVLTQFQQYKLTLEPSSSE